MADHSLYSNQFWLLQYRQYMGEGYRKEGVTSSQENNLLVNKTIKDVCSRSWQRVISYMVALRREKWVWAALGKVLNMAIVVVLEWFANATKHVRVRYWSRKGGLTETVMIADWRGYWCRRWDVRVWNVMFRRDMLHQGDLSSLEVSLHIVLNDELRT